MSNQRISSVGAALVTALILVQTLSACGSVFTQPQPEDTRTISPTTSRPSAVPVTTPTLALPASEPATTTPDLPTPPASAAASPDLPTPASEATAADPLPPTVQPGLDCRGPTDSCSPSSIFRPPSSDPLSPRVDQLLHQMTLEEKVGQLFTVYFTGPELSPALQKMIDDYHIGGIVLFSVAGNVKTMGQVGQLNNDAQAEALNHGAHIPLFIAVDQEGGPVVRLSEGATVFPSQMAIGATGSTGDARSMAEVTATELKAVGINMNLAPVMDVNDNPDNPVIGVRSFGSSPELVARMGVAMIDAYKQAGIIATAKHFPGHGDTSVDSHVGLPLVPRDLSHLESVELLPFKAAVQAGVGVVMTAHVLMPAIEPNSVPATLSATILQGILRQNLAFQGPIASDSLTMGALATTYGVTEATVRAFAAGADILTFGADAGHTPAEQIPAYQRIVTLLETGAIPASRLDEAVSRILLLKAQYGLLDWKPVDIAAIPQQAGTSSHAAINRRLAQDSITLVKNDQSVLPIKPTQSVLAVWPRGLGDLGASLQAIRPNVQVVQVGLDPSAAEIEQVVRAASTVDVVIVGTVNARHHPEQAHLINALSGRPLAVAALDMPYDVMSFPAVPCYLATYDDAPVSLDALTQVLFGLAKPRGHLPVDVPGLYPLGYGMSDD